MGSVVEVMPIAVFSLFMGMAMGWILGITQKRMTQEKEG